MGASAPRLFSEDTLWRKHFLWSEIEPSGVKREYYHEDGDGSEDKLLIKNTQDMTPFLEHNKYQAKEMQKGKGNFRKVATIPNIVIEDLMKKGIWTDKKAMKKWLNDPNNRAFRTNTLYL